MGILLAIDDDLSVLEALQKTFVGDGWEFHGYSEARSALKHPFPEEVDVILQDLELPDLGGVDLLTELRRTFPDASLVVLTGQGDVPDAVAAIQAGAEDFLQKPPELSYLRAVAERARGRAVIQREYRRAQGPTSGEDGLERLERFPSLRPLVREARPLANSDAVVLLQGETGTGKGWFARLLHAASPRSGRPFLELNCAGLNPGLVESELFGHEPGAFTDARHRKKGLFEVADGGTLFLDEIGEMDPTLQPRLLTALESKRFRRVGGTRELQVDVRIIVATNRPLRDDADEGRFRKDLFYRISTFPLELPPLRERGPGEILDLAAELLGELARELHRDPPSLSRPAEELLSAYPWPGNVRELRNALERALLLSQGADQIGPEHLPRELDRRVLERTGREGYPMDMPLFEVERHHTLGVLAHHDGNRARTARALGIGRRTLYDRLERYGMK